MSNSTIDIFGTVMAFFIFATLYYVFILAPRDAMLNEIMDCMGDQRSQAAYDACHKKLRPASSTPSH